MNFLVFLVYLAVPILIGIMAQKWKGRIGAAWGLMTLCLMLVIGFLITGSFVMEILELFPFDDMTISVSKLLLIAGSTLVVMGLIVATLRHR
ncbi:hypothetical protein LP7551_02067 [Roseibium album]|nr:hypothetical protein LP7551_02067 [Roseibium album]